MAGKVLNISILPSIKVRSWFDSELPEICTTLILDRYYIRASMNKIGYNQIQYSVLVFIKRNFSLVTE